MATVLRRARSSGVDGAVGGSEPSCRGRTPYPSDGGVEGDDRDHPIGRRAELVKNQTRSSRRLDVDPEVDRWTFMSSLEKATDQIEPDASAYSGPRRPIRTIGRCGFFVGVLLINAACGVPVDSAEPAETAESSATSTTVAPTLQDAAISTVPSIPLALVDDCVEQTMGRAYNGEEFWQEHWNHMNQDEAQLREWCDQYGNDDPEALDELSREWQLSLAAAAGSGTVAPAPIVPFVDPVVASTVPATTATTTTTTAPPPPPPLPPTPPPPPAPSNVSYQNCDVVRAAGAAPIHRGEPGYSSRLDRDGDGIGCE